MKKFMKVTYIVIGLEVLDDGQIFSCIARRKKRYNCVCKYRQTEETKTKTYIFVYKIFTNSSFKSYTTWQS